MSHNSNSHDDISRPLFGPLTPAKRKAPRSRFRKKAKRTQTPDGRLTRPEAVKVRMTPTEFECLVEAAGWAGVSLAMYLILCGLADWQRRRDARKAAQQSPGCP